MSFSIGQGWEHALDHYLTTPPEDDEKPVCRCCDCDTEIYEDDDYYEIDGNAYCESCMIDNFRKTARAKDYESEDYYDAE